MTTGIFKSTGAIIVYSIATIGLLAIAGYNWWGWFGGSDKWKAENPDTTGGRQGATDSGGTNERFVIPQENYMMGESSSSERTTAGGLRCFPSVGYFKDKAGNNISCPSSIMYQNGEVWVQVSRQTKEQCCYQKKGGSNPNPAPPVQPISADWGYEYVKGNDNNWKLVGYANKPIGKFVRAGDTIQTNPKSGIYIVNDVNYGSPRDSVSISSAMKGNPVPPVPQGSITKINVLPISPSPNPNIFYFNSLSNTGSSLRLYGKDQLKLIPPIGAPITLYNKTSGIKYPTSFQLIDVKNVATTPTTYMVEISWDGSKINSNTQGYITF